MGMDSPYGRRSVDNPFQGARKRYKFKAEWTVRGPVDELDNMRSGLLSIDKEDEGSYRTYFYDADSVSSPEASGEDEYVTVTAVYSVVFRLSGASEQFQTDREKLLRAVTLELKSRIVDALSDCYGCEEPELQSLYEANDDDDDSRPGKKIKKVARERLRSRKVKRSPNEFRPPKKAKRSPAEFRPPNKTKRPPEGY